MNRRMISLLLAVVLVLSLVGCKTKAKEEPIAAAPIPEGFFDQTKPADETETPAVTEKEQEEEPTTTSEEPTDGVQSEETKETEATDATEATEETQKPTNTIVQMTQYEWYHSLTGEQQMAYMETFESMDAFFDWYNAAKEEHEKERPSIDIGDGYIDLDKIIGGND